MFSKIFLSLLIGWQAMAKIEVHGHRGARAVLPENTIVAFEEALRVGAEFIELDTGVSRDKSVVVAHDQYVNADICLNADGSPVKTKMAIYSLDLKQIKSFDCGSKPNKRFPKQKPVPGQRIPTLDEVFEYVSKSKDPNAKKVRFNIETKIEAEYPELSPSPEEFVSLVLAVVKKYGFESRVVIQSFDYRTLAEVRKKEPAILISALVDTNKKSLVQIAEEVGPNIISPRFNLLRADNVKAVQKVNIQVVPWTANDPGDWKDLISYNVDGIITDDPAALIHYLKQYR